MIGVADIDVAPEREYTPEARVLLDALELGASSDDVEVLLGEIAASLNVQMDRGRDRSAAEAIAAWYRGTCL